MNVLVITYEFTYNPFSGNGILARSLVKSLLVHHGDDFRNVCVWCCRPYYDSSTTNNHEENHSKNNHLSMPELSVEQVRRLQVYPITLSQQAGWKRLDDQSGYNEFHWSRLTQQYDNDKNNDEKKTHHHPLYQFCMEQGVDVVCAIDWTGYHAWQSIPWKNNTTTIIKPPLMYLNFRVFSSGVTNPQQQLWYNQMEQRALFNATMTIALSQHDAQSLDRIRNNQNNDDDSNDNKIPNNNNNNNNTIQILYPPIRGDVVTIATKQTHEERVQHLPVDIANRIRTQSPRRCRHRCFITCLVRLSPEKDVLRFVQFIQTVSNQIRQQGYIPLLAGSCADPEYARLVKEQLIQVYPNSMIVNTFLSSSELTAILSCTVFNFHPCSYDAYGMTIVEAAALGVPSIVASGGTVGALAIIGTDACIQVDMSQPSKQNSLVESKDNLQHWLSPASIDKLRQTITMDINNEVEELGRRAQDRALAWNEAAYGEALVNHMKSVIQKGEKKKS